MSEVVKERPVPSSLVCPCEFPELIGDKMSWLVRNWPPSAQSAIIWAVSCRGRRALNQSTYFTTHFPHNSYAGYSFSNKLDSNYGFLIIPRPKKKKSLVPVGCQLRWVGNLFYLNILFFQWQRVIGSTFLLLQQKWILPACCMLNLCLSFFFLFFSPPNLFFFSKLTK